MSEMKPTLLLEYFYEDAAELDFFEETSIDDIKAIWLRQGDVDYDDDYLNQKELPYKWEDPLYMKMVHRFRNCNRRIAQFYHQIDPHNQELLLMKRFARVYLHNRGIAKEMISFLAWTSNMIGAHEVLKPLETSATDITEIERERRLHYWRTRPISFFMTLPQEIAAKWLDRYNREEVDTYNSYHSGKLYDSKAKLDAFKHRLEDISKNLNEHDRKLLMAVGCKVLNFEFDETILASLRTPPLYKTTIKGLWRFDLLTESKAHTPEGVTFREEMTKTDWQMEQLLTILDDEPSSRDEILWNLNLSLVEGRPLIHFEMITILDELIANALKDELIAIADK